MYRTKSRNYCSFYAEIQVKSIAYVVDLSNLWYNVVVNIAILWVRMGIR